MTDGPFTDDMIRHGLATVQTQHGIIKCAEAMAQVLAEAGRASAKATGDRAEHAVHQWAQVILARALELLRQDKNQPALDSSINRCPSCKRLFKDGDTCVNGGCPMGGDF